MYQQLYQIDLVRRAQQGDRQSLDQLAQQARERLRTYVYRLTQRDDLAQEIVQESLLEMCRVIGKLKKSDRFWPWLYGIAINKLRRHYRTERTQRRVAFNSVTKKSSLQKREDGLEKLVSKELKHIVSSAMSKLRTRHKAVLIMRCYDGMKYSEIAESMGCSEFSTRMLFMRAKKSLQKELSRNGFGKSSLLAALILFGKITAPSEAAAAQVSVTAAATKVGLLAGIAGLATTKTAIVSLTAAGALTAGTIVATSGHWRQPTDGWQAPSTFSARSQAVSQFGQEGAGEEYWYYFPQGPENPMMLRVRQGKTDVQVGSEAEPPRQRPAKAGIDRQILQNDRANYYYHDNRVYINNYRLFASDLSVLKLPTDDPELIDFICRLEGSTSTLQHIKSTGRGLLVVAARSQTENGGRQPWAIRHFNVLDEDYFQGDWPATATTIDNRDVMHKRGWTYFRISGQISGRRVSGTGRIPFIYLAGKRYRPWLKLQVGSLEIVDTYNKAYQRSVEPDRLEIFKSGSFFKGLARPWMGLHTIDTVRRDAAEQRIRFETKHTPGSRFAQVELLCKDVRLIYKIDLETDVIDEIIFSAPDKVGGGQDRLGNLEFSYIQSLDTLSGAVNDEFVHPEILRHSAVAGVPKKSPGLLWLVQLVEDSLK